MLQLASAPILEATMQHPLIAMHQGQIQIPMHAHPHPAAGEETIPTTVPNQPPTTMLRTAEVQSPTMAIQATSKLPLAATQVQHHQEQTTVVTPHHLPHVTTAAVTTAVVTAVHQVALAEVVTVIHPEEDIVIPLAVTVGEDTQVAAAVDTVAAIVKRYMPNDEIKAYKLPKGV